MEKLNALEMEGAVASSEAHKLAQNVREQLRKW